MKPNWVSRPLDLLPKSNKNVWWTCPKDPSHEYRVSPSERARGRGCPYCAGKQVNHTNSLAARSAILKDEWDPENAKKADEVAAKSDYLAGWICRFDPAHRWTAAVSSRPSNGKGCPFCDGKRPSRENRLDVQRPSLSKQWHPTRNLDLMPAMVTTGSNKKVWWICPEDPEHVWQTTVRARAMDGDGCKWCAPVIRSRVDIGLACELAGVFPQDVDPVKQPRLELGHNRPHSVDVLITSLKIVIEFDGSFSHRGEDHIERDRTKTELLRERGYRVVRVREQPLEKLDPDHDLIVQTLGPKPDFKQLTNQILCHLEHLGWVKPAAVHPYLTSLHAWGTRRAEEIYESLPPSERFVPLSVKAARN